MIAQWRQYACIVCGAPIDEAVELTQWRCAGCSAETAEDSEAEHDGSTKRREEETK